MSEPETICRYHTAPHPKMARIETLAPGHYLGIFDWSEIVKAIANRTDGDCSTIAVLLAAAYRQGLLDQSERLPSRVSAPPGVHFFIDCGEQDFAKEPVEG